MSRVSLVFGQIWKIVTSPILSTITHGFAEKPWLTLKRLSASNYVATQLSILVLAAERVILVGTTHQSERSSKYDPILFCGVYICRDGSLDISFGNHNLCIGCKIATAVSITVYSCAYGGMSGFGSLSCKRRHRD